MSSTPPSKQYIHFVITGGTIDSYYDGTKDTVIPLKQSVIPRFINNLKLPGRHLFAQVCMKDSRGLTKSDIRAILKTVEKSPAKRIIITHGTYTMADTARFLKANLRRKDQVVILTGAFIPLDGFTFSDAPFNLGFALAKLSELAAGVYLCMNGCIFSSDEAMKIISRGVFDSIFGEKK